MRWVPPAYLLLFALFPALSLWGANAGEVEAVSLLRAAAVVVAVAWAGWAFAHALGADRAKAGVLVGLATVAALSWSILRDALYSLVLLAGAAPLARARFALAAIALVLAAAAWALWRTRSDVGAARVPLNVAALGMCVVALAPGLLGALVDAPDAVVPASADMPPERPDVYYVVLDMYARPDILRDRYGHDITPFTDHLASQGFHVVPHSTSNYPSTVLSIPSAFAMDYVNELADAQPAASLDEGPLFSTIPDSEVMRRFDGWGYEITTFDTIGSALGPRVDHVVRCQPWSEFELALWQGSLASLAWSPAPATKREAIACQMAALREVAARDAPQFVFAHVLLPHHPYVFDSEGAPVALDYPPDTPENRPRVVDMERAAYLEQLDHTNKLVTALVDDIIAADPEAIIILQSDHGAGLIGLWEDADLAFMEDRLGNFEALRVPGAAAAPPHDLTPVNLFRWVFREAFATDDELLPTRNYFRDHDVIYRVRDVTDALAPHRGEPTPR